MLGPGRAARRALYLFLTTILAAFTLISSASSQAKQPPPPAPSITIDSDAKFAIQPEKVRLKLLISMVRARRHQLAARLLTSYPFTGPHARNRTLFIEGIILKSRNDIKGATGKFRSALADDPNLSLVRMELAHTLYLAKQDDGAKHHLELLRSSAPTIETGKQFDGFIDAIDARDPWSLDAYVSLAPSTNFNNGTSEEIIIINGLPFRLSRNSRGKSGIGYRGGANGSHALRTGKSLDFIAGAGVNFTEYDGNAFDDLILSQSLSVQKRTGKGRLTASVIATQRWSGLEEFSLTIGPQITLRHRIAPKLAMFTKLRHSVIDYRHAKYRSGHKTSAEQQFSYSLADGTVAYLIGGGERSTSKQKFNDYWAASAGLGLYHEAPYGITLYGEAEVRRQWHEGIYPIIAKARKDTRVDIQITLKKRDFDILGLTPQVQYSYIRNFSNSAIDRYETHGANITLTKKF